MVGTLVTFEVVAGPHIGVLGSDTTDASGVASISYIGVLVGTDTIEATFVDALGRTQRSNRVTKTWEERPIEIDLTPDVAVNDIEVSPDHTVTATVLFGGLPLDGAVVKFTVAGVSGPVGMAVVTDAAGEAAYTYPGVALGFDTITACVEGDVCDEVSKEWVDKTAPRASCTEGVNPAGNTPNSPGKGGKHQNPDGFYQISAQDFDLAAIIVTDLGDDGMLGTADDFVYAGPFANGDMIKYTENKAKPSQKDAPGEVRYKLTGNGDLVVQGVDGSGNLSDPAFCLVPPDPS